MPGHTLIIPKRHIEKPWELTTEELLDIFNNIWWAEHKLLKGGIATGCDIRQNYRPFMPQGRVKVNHLHFHVMPRTLEDKLYQESMRFERDLFKDLPEDEREQVVKLFA
jgi:histidine triad (HIT) family protein